METHTGIFVVLNIFLAIARCHVWSFTTPIITGYADYDVRIFEIEKNEDIGGLSIPTVRLFIMETLQADGRTIFAISGCVASKKRVSIAIRYFALSHF
jgi:hypothetical protein